MAFLTIHLPAGLSSADRARARASGPRAVDSRGDLYVGEVCWTLWPGLFPGQPHPANLRALQKYERIH